MLKTLSAEYQDGMVFDAPLDLSQVDYVKYGDTIIPVEFE